MQQQESKPHFITAHLGVVKGVAFSPKERYILCSGGTDGKVNVYNALQHQHIMSIKITSPTAMKNINAVKFNADGSRILSTSKRLSVIDAERGELICSYDSCAYSGRDKAPLASDPLDPNMAICTNGKGLITFDLRKPTPAHFALNVHSDTIRDIIYLDRSWPFYDNLIGMVVSLSEDGICKIRTIDDKPVHVFDVGHRSRCVTVTPDVYSSRNRDGLLESMLMVGGECLSGYLPASRDRKYKLITWPNERTMQNLKYTSNGHTLYATVEGGLVRRYRRVGIEHELLSEIYSHEDEIFDMDISPNDEYIATASKDGRVGLMCLGAPSVGWTGYMELA